MIDSHAHIDSEDFDFDFDEMIKRANDTGIDKIIIPAIEPKFYNKILDIISKNNNIYCSMGVHPHNAHDYNLETEELIVKNLSHKKVIAVGEIGLDYYYDFCPKAKQIEVFQKQISLALENKLPIIIHNREADDDIFNLLKENQNGKLEGVLHCFSSTVDFMKKCIDLGFHISFTGNITFKKSNLSEVVREVPLDRVLIETDSPFMTPVPHRGKRNEPKFVKLVAEKISEIKNISYQEVVKMTTDNAKKLFRLTIIILIFIIFNNSTFAQNKSGIEDNVDEDSLSLEHPYYKIFGLCPMVGTNTVVETYYDIDPTKPNSDKDISREGIFAYGGSLNYYAMDFLSFEFNYMYSKDTKIARDFDYKVDPTIYQVIELTSHWTPNPYNLINYFGTIGVTYFNTSINKVISSNIGMNFGIGFLINFNFDNYGIIALQGEWRLDYSLTKSKAPFMQYQNQVPVIVEKDRTVYYSIPRFGLYWYPKF